MQKMLTSFLGLGLLLGLSAGVWADEQTDCKAIIEKGFKARGDVDKLAKMTASTTTTKGTVHIMGNPLPYKGEQTVQQPDKLKAKFELDLMGMAFVVEVVFDGKQGWRKINDNVDDMSEEEVAEQKLSQHANAVTQLAPLLKDPGYTFTSLGEGKVEGKAVVGVRVAKKDQRDVSLWFDKETGLLAKSETRAKDVMQNMEFAQETIYGNYKTIDGIKHAMKLTIKRDGNPFVESEVSEVKLSESVPANTFAKP